MPTPALDIKTKLKAVQALQDLDEATISKLSEGLGFQRIEKGQVLFHGGDPAEACFIVAFGSVKLLRPLIQGKEIVMCFLRPGDFIGAAVMTHPSPRFPLTAIAMEDSGLVVIPRKIYLSSWQSNPQVARAVNVSIMTRMMEFQDDKAMVASSVPQKIARFILRTLDQQPETYGNRLSLKLSRKDVAERVGTSVETVIRTLSQWTQNGYIETQDQQIVVLDREALQGLLES